MGLGVTTLLVASSLIAGQASPAVSTETTFMNQTIDENKIYTEEDFPVDYTPKACDCGGSWHNDEVDYYENDDDRFYNLSRKEGVVSLTNGITSYETFHSRIDFDKAWLGKGYLYYEPRSHTTITISDYDCYTFSLFESRKVTISIDASSDAYFCTIAKHQYESYPFNQLSGKYGDVLLSKSESDSGTFTFSDVLEPGGYMITFNRSASSYNRKEGNYVYSSNINYSIDFFSERVSKVKEYSIYDLKYNKNLKAAIWSSDYRPYGIEPKVQDDSSFFTRKTGYDYYLLGNMDCSLQALMDDLKDDAIPSDIIYVWDDELSQQLYEGFSKLKDTLTKNAQILLDKAEQEAKNYDRATKLVDYCVAFLEGMTMTCAPVPATIICLTIDGFISVIERYLEPEDPNVTRDSLTDLVSFLALVMANLKDKKEEVIHQIPLFYRVWNNNDDSYGTHLLTGISVFRDYDNLTRGGEFGWDFEYDVHAQRGSMLSTNPNEAHGFHGSLLGIKEIQYDNGTSGAEIGDIDSFVNEYKPVETIDTITPDDNLMGVVESSFKVDSIAEGDYRWYKYTTSKSSPHAFIVTADNPVTMELFNEQSLGYYNGGRFAKVDATSVKNGRYGAFYDLYLKKGVTVWIRIRGTNNYSLVNSSSVTVSYESSNGIPITMQKNYVTLKHVHTYGYRYATTTDGDLEGIACDRNGNVISCHRSYCWKDDCYILESHTYSVSYSFKDRLYLPRCSKCGYLKSLTYKVR